MTPAFNAAATQALMRALVGSCLLSLPSLMNINSAGVPAGWAVVLQLLIAAVYLIGGLFMVQSFLGLRAGFAALSKARIESGRGGRNR